MMPEFKIDQATVSFWLKVKPRSARERLALDASGELRLELHAPPVEGQANEACISFFSHALRLPRACVAIVSGQKSRRKLLRIAGRPAEETLGLIKALVCEDGNT